MSETIITDIQLQLLNRPRFDGHLGFASIVLNGAYGLSDIGIHKKEGGGIRLNFPDKLLRNGRKIQVFYPLNAEARAVIEKAIEEEIEKQRGGGELKP